MKQLSDACEWNFCVKIQTISKHAQWCRQHWGILVWDSLNISVVFIHHDEKYELIAVSEDGSSLDRALENMLNDCLIYCTVFPFWTLRCHMQSTIIPWLNLRLLVLYTANWFALESHYGVITLDRFFPMLAQESISATFLCEFITTLLHVGEQKQWAGSQTLWSIRRGY